MAVPKDHWSLLTRAEQFQIALDLARRRGPTLVQDYDNVISVGAGFRLKGKTEDMSDEVCLCFFVRRKWSDRRQRKQKIPEQVTTYVNRGGKRVAVRVPTDVSELSGGQPQSTQNLTQGIVSRASGNPLDLGSTCCLVRNTAMPNERYLLTCYHVFSGTLGLPPPGGLDCSTEDNVRLGPLVDAALPTGPNALDAALVSVEDATIEDISIWGLMPRQRATDFDVSELVNRGQLFLLARQALRGTGGQPIQVRDQPVPALFRALLPGPTPFNYQDTAGRTLFFADTIQYKASVRGGDSGAALVDMSGMVYGMHFYGRGDTGFALAAPRLFDPGVFSLDIEL